MLIRSRSFQSPSKKLECMLGSILQLDRGKQAPVSDVITRLSEETVLVAA